MDGPQHLRLKSLDVERINIVDPDGQRKMALFDSAHKPEIFMAGEEFAGLRQGSIPACGILFYNGEGDECGGLIFGSRQLEDGTYEQGLLLAFDAFRNDQVLFLSAEESAGNRTAALQIWDRPPGSLVQDLKALQAATDPASRQAVRERVAQGHAQRLSLGTASDHSLALSMNDSKGRTRLRVAIDAQDRPKLEFLDENGAVTASMPPQATPRPADGARDAEHGTTDIRQTPLRCSFCGAQRSNVRTLIAGAGVFICSDCVRLCVHILEEDGPTP